MNTITRILLALLFVLSSQTLIAQEQETTTLDAETQKLWDAHTVVPKTDDVKELRAFLKYGDDNWMQMNGRLRGAETWQRFHIAKNQATFEAADRILALVKDEPGEEPPPPQTYAEFFGWDQEIDDVTFALQMKINAFGGSRKRDSAWARKYRDFIDEIKKNPAHKYVEKFAEHSWYAQHFNAAVWPHDVGGDEPVFEESLRAYEESFENLKRYCLENDGDPYIKFGIDNWKTPHVQAAEILERRGKLKKGMLAKPALEFYRSLYEKYEDAPQAEGWLRNINNDLVKYDVLTAEDQLAAFQVKVEELRQLLETGLNEDSRMKVSGLHQIAEELDCRNEALRLLLTTARPIFAASQVEEHQMTAVAYDIALNHLALEGVEYELEGVLTDGTKINLKDYRGKVVVLDYWATWCGPCVGDMPNMKQFYEGWHKDRGVEVIGISVDEDLDALKAFLEKEQIPWPNVSEKLTQEQNLASSQEQYKINSYPTTILIDQNGQVVRAGGGLYSVVREIRKLFPVEEK